MWIGRSLDSRYGICFMDRKEECGELPRGTFPLPGPFAASCNLSKLLWFAVVV